MAAKQIKMADVAKQATLLKQSKKFFAIQQSIEYSLARNLNHVYWLFIIRDLIQGAGYNYSRIAKKVGVSPSTIQKLITHPGRRPRQYIFESLLVLYHQVFNGPYVTQSAFNYLQKRPFDVLAHLPKEWIKRLVAITQPMPPRCE